MSEGVGHVRGEWGMSEESGVSEESGACLRGLEHV